jgi:DNA (cytosine-5)-methyltransferase 1
MGKRLKIGSLCTGYGGLDLAVEEHFNAETVWCAEFDKYASQVIEQRFNIPNYGNIKEIDWASLEPIDILTAGYPCQPFSHAGYRKGTDDERHIFPYILEAISILRPRWVILENVRGHLTLGLKEVLAGLASIRYDARWQVVRASDAGAPHQRARLFIVAYPKGWGSGSESIGVSQEKPGTSCSCKATTNSHSDACQESRRALRGVSGEAREVIYGSDRAIYGCSHQDASNTNNQHKSHDRQVQELGRRFTPRCEMHMQEPPDALDQDGKLSVLFVEYMMGLPVGWVTDTGLSRAQQLKMLGNGVVPQQAKLALELSTEVIHRVHN